MTCPTCGAPTRDGAKFCSSCGSPLPQESAPEDVQETVVAEQVTETVQEPAPERPCAPDAPTAPSPEPPQPQFRPQPPVQPAREGVLGAAWRDITSSPGWVGRTALLALMGVFPVVGFYVNGYLLRWSAELVNGARTALPKGVFDRKAFLTGFLYWVVTFLCGLAASVLVVLNVIPVLGAILAWLGFLCVNCYAAVAGIRMALSGRFGAAFDLSQIVEVLKRNPGSAFVAVFVPSLVTGLVGVLVSLMVVAVFGAASCSALAKSVGYASYGYGYGLSSGSDGALGALGVIFGILGPLVGIVVVVLMFCSVFGTIWSLRAFGHFVAENAPEWAVDADAADSAEKAW